MTQKLCKNFIVAPNGKSVRCRAFITKDGFCKQHHPEQKLTVLHRRVARASVQLAVAVEQQTDFLQSLHNRPPSVTLSPLSFLLSASEARQ